MFLRRFFQEDLSYSLANLNKIHLVLRTPLEVTFPQKKEKAEKFDCGVSKLYLDLLWRLAVLLSYAFELTHDLTLLLG